MKHTQKAENLYEVDLIPPRMLLVKGRYAYMTKENSVATSYRDQKIRLNSCGPLRRTVIWALG